VRMLLHHVHRKRWVGMVLGSRWVGGFKICHMGGNDFIFPFLDFTGQEQLVTKSIFTLTCCNSARTSSATPYSSNSCLMASITSSMTAR
jgi:hypothetical protein